MCLSIAERSYGQPPETETQPTADPSEGEAAIPEKVAVAPEATDEEIAARLERIMSATSWFENPSVRVDEGVAFISASAQREEHKIWAGNLARNTQDVVAVVNQIEVAVPSVFDLTPANNEIARLTREAIALIPSLLVVALVLFFTWWAGKLAHRVAGRLASRRTRSPLLPQIISKIVAVLVFVLGAYFALRISGLTRLAATVLGGTGLAGLVLGIAFRDIAENFLASVLISLKRPFERGDVIAVAGYEGIVRTVTTRGTTLMTFDGNHVQIPNSTIYKNVIRNFSSNPNTRLEFTVGIDYGDPIPAAQSLILETITSHNAVLDDPESLVLVESLATSTVNLRVLFWVDTNFNSNLKVRSAIIRLVKRALTDASFTLPDEAREVIFPRGVDVRLAQATDEPKGAIPPTARRSSPSEPAATLAEGDLKNDRDAIERQAKLARVPDEGTDIL